MTAMRGPVVRRARADSSLSASSTASRTKFLMVCSPQGLRMRSPKPPAKPLTPAKPTPLTSQAPPSPDGDQHMAATVVENSLDPRRRSFYVAVLDALANARPPFLVGGAYAFERYTGVQRHTKDLDIFVRKDDADATLDLLARQG